MRLILALVLSLGLIGCTRADADRAPAEKTAAAPAPGAVALETEVATRTAAAPDHAMPAEAAGSCCGGGQCGGGECGGGGCGGACGGGCGAAASAAATPTDAPADARWSTMQVAGMHCGGCERRISAALAHLDGVVAVQADHATGQVRWAVASGRPDLRQQVGDEIRKLGYQPQL